MFTTHNKDLQLVNAILECPLIPCLSPYSLLSQVLQHFRPSIRPKK